MNHGGFRDRCETLFNHFMAGVPSNFDDKVNNAFYHVRDVPVEAADWVVENAIRTLDGMPRNLVKLFLDGWDRWKSAHPNRVQKAKEAFRWCDSCAGEGLIWFYEVKNEGKKYEVHGRCADCGNWRKHFNEMDAAGPAVTMDFLVQSGKQLTPAQESIRKCIELHKKTGHHRSPDSHRSYSLRHVQRMSEKIGSS